MVMFMVHNDENQCLYIIVNHDEEWFIIIVKSTEVLVNHPIGVLSINLNGHINK